MSIQSAKDIFLNALEWPAAEREAFVRGACRGDEALGRRVEALLQAHGAEFLAHPTVAGESRGAFAEGNRTAANGEGGGAVEGPGSIIGPYKLLQKIGEGGFGVVYMAEQEQPVRRTVALKIIKLGMDTRQVVARFEAERQALALMDHPNIARVLDGGATDTGRPYFVMELVRGISITDYCDRNNLSPHERIRLFIEVCHAVHHAHQKGIIHRDIKPSNVLVTLHDGRPVPKVIDFGIAKAVHQRLTDKTLFTEFGQFIGTPEYMSPEQAEMSGLDIDTRGDIYSLGVLLYELLTGTTPCDRRQLRAAALAEMQRLICESDPPRPSTRLSTIGHEITEVATRRGTDPTRLSRMLRGDLDWIVMKAIEKDRTRRYQSASALSDDIQRYLKTEPVMAGPPSAAYRLRRHVQRHRTAVAAAALLALVVIMGIVGTSGMAVSAIRQRDRAERQVRIAELTNAFLNDELLAQADPMHEPDRDIRLRTVVDRAAERIEGRFEDEPLVEAAIRTTLGTTFQGLAEYDPAREHLTAAHELRRSALGEDHPDTMRALRAVARVEWKAARLDEAAAIAGPLLERQLRVSGPDDRDTLDTKDLLAVVLKGAGRFDEAERLLVETLESRRRTLGDEHLDTLFSMNNLGALYQHLGRYEEAAALHQKTLELRRRVLGDEHLHTLASMSNLALVWQLMGRHDETEPLFRQVLDTRRRVLGEAHQETLVALNNMGYMYTRSGRYEEARPYYEQTLSVRRETMGDEHPHTLLSMNNLGWLYTNLGLLAEAEPLLLEMLHGTGRTMGLSHPDYFRSLGTVGKLYEEQERLPEALSMYERALEGFREVLPADHPDLGIGMTAHGRCLAKLGRLDEGETVLLEAAERLLEALGPAHRRVHEAYRALADLYDARDEPERAAEYRNQLDQR